MEAALFTKAAPAKPVFSPATFGDSSSSWRSRLSEPVPRRSAAGLRSIRRDIDTYRDNAVHFYNEAQFGVVVYALAQTSIINFKDLLLDDFCQDLSDEINWSLLPLGLKAPVDPIDYISGKGKASGSKSGAVQQFLREIQAADEVEKAGEDTGRVLTIFKVKLESTKKIEKADVLVGVTKAEDAAGPLTVVKTVDPNVSHPHRQKDQTNQEFAWHAVYDPCLHGRCVEVRPKIESSILLEGRRGVAYKVRTGRYKMVSEFE